MPRGGISNSSNVLFHGISVFKGIKLVVVDCANGAAYKSYPDCAAGTRARSGHYQHPDGMNINDVRRRASGTTAGRGAAPWRAHLSIALDGDADRIDLCLRAGEIVDGDHVMAALGLNLHAQGRLASQTVVGTVASNFGLELAMKKAGIQLMRTPVGIAI